jgi:hypothetical protein
MSVRSYLIKTAIKMTPSALIIWVANYVLKGIAELTAFDFDVEQRKLYVQTQLYGEEGTIEVVMEDFALFHDGESYRFILYHASSDRPWLNNILAKIIGKAWPIPALPQLDVPLQWVAELFQVKPLALESQATVE